MDHLDRARTDPSARRAEALAFSRASTSRTFSEALRGARHASARSQGASSRSPERPAGRAANGPTGTGEEGSSSRDPVARPLSGDPRRRGPERDPLPAAEPALASTGHAAEVAPGRADAAGTAAGEAAGLRATVRALPVAVETFQARGTGAVALELGRALSVELRSAAGGVEILLRPEASLARVAASELPGLVHALRARGVTVASAAVRARPRRG